MLHAYDFLFKTSCCLPFAMIPRFFLRDMLYPYWHILLFIPCFELCSGRSLLFVILCYFSAIKFDFCVWNVFVQGKLMKYVSHTIITISSIVVIVTVIIFHFTSSSDILSGGADICNCKSSANEWCMIECESIMADKGLIYGEKHRAKNWTLRSTWVYRSKIRAMIT